MSVALTSDPLLGGHGPSADPDPPVGQRPAGLSPSRAADFMSCPLRYRFRVVDRLPERRTPAAARGTLVHAVLDRLFDLPAAQRTPQRAAALVEPEWRRLLDADPALAAAAAPRADHGDPDGAGGEGAGTAGAAGGIADGHSKGDPAAPDAPDDVGAQEAGCQEAGWQEAGWQEERWLESARRLLDGYFGLEDPRRLEPAEREQLVSAVLDSGLALRGYVDRLDATPTGELRVVDYKTGRTPGEAYEGRALFQLKFYALMLWRTRGRVPAELRLLYLDEATMLRYAPDERELRAFERILDALWRAVTRATATGDFRPRPGALCSWCDHRDLCPAWGGTAPPLPAPAAPPGSVPPQGPAGAPT